MLSLFLFSFILWNLKEGILCQSFTLTEHFNNVGGCTHWCETGWYSSPAFDTLSDGRGVIFGGAYSVYAIDVTTGENIWKGNSGSGDDNSRVWPGVAVVSSFQSEGDHVVINGNGNGWVCARNAETGEKLWCKQPDGSNREIRSLAVSPLEENGPWRVIVAIAKGESTNLIYVLDTDGNTIWSRPRSDEDGYCWFNGNQNIAVADINGDGNMEIIETCDTHYNQLYDKNGEPWPAHEKFDQDPRVWGRVGWNRNEIVDMRGWGHDDLRPNFCHGSPSTFELNGETLIALPGNYHDIETNINQYHTIFIARENRKRFVDEENGWNWTWTPDNDHWVEQKYDVIESCMPNIAIADIDGDGYPEFVYPNNDGLLHCNWLDKSEKHNWPIALTDSNGVRFSSEVSIFSLNGKGMIVFSTWGLKSANTPGFLHIHNFKGEELLKQEITGENNGALGAPLLFKYSDSFDNLLISIQTIGSGNHMYELNGASINEVEILWGTGKGNNFRTGNSDAISNTNGYYTKIKIETGIFLGVFTFLMVIFCVVVVAVIVFALFFVLWYLPKKGDTKK